MSPGATIQFCRVGDIVKSEKAPCFGGPFIPVGGQIHGGFGSLYLFQVGMRLLLIHTVGRPESVMASAKLSRYGRIALAFNRAPRGPQWLDSTVMVGIAVNRLPPPHRDF